MTRKHFEELAKFCGVNSLDNDLLEDLASVCKSFNANFQREKFYERCFQHRTRNHDLR